MRTSMFGKGLQVARRGTIAYATFDARAACALHLRRKVSDKKVLSDRLAYAATIARLATTEPIIATWIPLETLTETPEVSVSDSDA